MLLKMENPFGMLVCGPTSSGKTTFIINMLKNPGIFENRFHKILWCNKEKNAIPKNLYGLNIDYIHEIPENFENPNGKPMLIILDDMMTDAAANLKICELFTKGSHHRNLSIILITQNIFHQGKYCRDISLNAKYIVVFKNPRDKTQFNHLARQIYPENTLALQRLYKEITQAPHSYLFIDLSQGINESLRFRTDIFNKDFSTIFCSKDLLTKENGISNETFKGQQIYALRTEKCCT
jgi:hypothetical protein